MATSSEKPPFYYEPSVPCSQPYPLHPHPPQPCLPKVKSTKKGIRAFPILPWLLTTICPFRGLSLPLTQLMLFSHGNKPAVAAATTISTATGTITAHWGARNCGGFSEKTSLQAQKNLSLSLFLLTHTHTNTYHLTNRHVCKLSQANTFTKSQRQTWNVLPPTTGAWKQRKAVHGS